MKSGNGKQIEAPKTGNEKIGINIGKYGKRGKFQKFIPDGNALCKVRWEFMKRDGWTGGDLEWNIETKMKSRDFFEWRSSCRMITALLEEAGGLEPKTVTEMYKNPEGGLNEKGIEKISVACDEKWLDELKKQMAGASSVLNLYVSFGKMSTEWKNFILRTFADYEEDGHWNMEFKLKMLMHIYGNDMKMGQRAVYPGAELDINHLPLLYAKEIYLVDPAYGDASVRDAAIRKISEYAGNVELRFGEKDEAWVHLPASDIKIFFKQEEFRLNDDFWKEGLDAIMLKRPNPYRHHLPGDGLHYAPDLRKEFESLPSVLSDGGYFIYANLDHRVDRVEKMMKNMGMQTHAAGKLWCEPATFGDTESPANQPAVLMIKNIQNQPLNSPFYEHFKNIYGPEGI